MFRKFLSSPNWNLISKLRNSRWRTQYGAQGNRFFFGKNILQIVIIMGLNFMIFKVAENENDMELTKILQFFFNIQKLENKKKSKT